MIMARIRQQGVIVGGLTTLSTPKGNQYLFNIILQQLDIRGNQESEWSKGAKVHFSQVTREQRPTF